MIELLECTCIEAYKARKMRDPNCCACSCDHNGLVGQLAKANERADKAESRLKESNKALAGMFWYFTPDGDKYPLAEKALNKFAIENQIKGIEKAIANSPSRLKYSLPLVDTTELYDYAEQLRKEQE